MSRSLEQLTASDWNEEVAFEQIGTDGNCINAGRYIGLYYLQGEASWSTNTPTRKLLELGTADRLSKGRLHAFAKYSHIYIIFGHIKF
jgi:hypothetical protein